MKPKIPVSVLVVIHTPDLQVLLIERADRPGFWQSVTGSQEQGETLRQTAVREIGEETGLDESAGVLTDWRMQNVFEIYPEWRWRYAPGVTRNTEHVFGFCVPRPVVPRLAPREHVAYEWLPHDRAAEKVFSWSNARALRVLPEHAGAA
ncbi:MAG TPA: dihydroneopterin triphosphate diphosphatase [Burkholderiales bacterium]|nr:dihydroneopterin triphosphate diphosphatase [Burkholderiales bacterium]